jgi:hypothetical protein
LERSRQGRTQLLKQARQGSRTAWGRLEPIYAPVLTTEALMLVRCYLSGPVSDAYRRQLAQEIAASAFGTAALQADQAKWEFWTDWLRATVKNETFRALRPEVRAMTSWLRQREARRLAQRGLEPDVSDDPADAVAQEELRRLLEFHLNDPAGCIPQFARPAALLRWKQGRREREIARATGQSPKAVRRQLRIAAARLIEALLPPEARPPAELEDELVERLARFQEGGAEGARGPRRRPE